MSGAHSQRRGAGDPSNSTLWRIPPGSGVSRLSDAMRTWLPGDPLGVFRKWLYR
jgi:hypothetical protein